MENFAVLLRLQVGNQLAFFGRPDAEHSNHSLVLIDSSGRGFQ